MLSSPTTLVHGLGSFLLEELILSCRKPGYPPIINFGHCLASCLSEKRTNRPISGFGWDFKASLISLVESLILFAFAGSTAVNLFVFSRPATYTSHQIFVIHLLSWLLVNTPCTHQILSSPPSRFIILILDTIDTYYTGIHQLQKAEMIDPGNWALRITTGFVYFFGGALMRKAYRSINGEKSESIPSGKIVAALFNIVIFSIFLAFTCGTLPEGLGEIFAPSPATLPNTNDPYYSDPTKCYEISDNTYTLILLANIFNVLRTSYFPTLFTWTNREKPEKICAACQCTFMAGGARPKTD